MAVICIIILETPTAVVAESSMYLSDDRLEEAVGEDLVVSRLVLSGLHLP